MGHNRMDNPYGAPNYSHLTPRAWTGQATPGEKFEPEDVTGLRLLEEFLTKRRSARDGDERE